MVKTENLPNRRAKKKKKLKETFNFFFFSKIGSEEFQCGVLIALNTLTQSSNTSLIFTQKKKTLKSLCKFYFHLVCERWSIIIFVYLFCGRVDI